MSITRPKNDDVTTPTTTVQRNQLTTTTKNINETLSKPLPKAEKTFTGRYMDAAFTGAFGGGISALFTYFIDRVNVLVQTAERSMTYRQAAKTVYHNNPTAGLGTTIGMASIKQGVLFPVQEGSKILVEKINPGGKANQGISGAIAGWISVGITNPIAVIKVMLYHNVPFSKILKMPLDTFARGIFLTGLRDSLHWGVFFQAQNEVKKHTDNPLLQGVVPNTIAALVNQPVATLATLKKYTGENTFNTAKKLVAEQGATRLYAGLGGTLVRMGICQGGGISLGIFAAKKFREAHDSYKQLNNNKVENKAESSIKRKM